MSHVPSRVALLAIAAVLPVVAHAGATAAAALPPDHAFFTSYSMGPGNTSVDWTVCGSTAATKGCHGSGTMGPFGSAASLIEGNPVVDSATGTVTREIYVCDVVAGTGKTHAVLKDFRKTDVVSSSGDATSVALVKSVPLSLAAGAGAACFMAADDGFVFVGTDKDVRYAKVAKDTLGVKLANDVDVDISSMTADAYGYVHMTFGNSVFESIAADGKTAFLASGIEFKVGKTLGLTNKNLPHFFHDHAVSQGRRKFVPRDNTTQTVAGTQAASPDSGLWTDYYPSNNFNAFEFVVCGAIGGTHTCFDPVVMGVAGYAAAIIEGDKKTNASTGEITRVVYMCDVNGSGVTLDVYERSDLIVGSNDTISAKLLKAVSLPLPSGANETCWMAANDKYLFVGINPGKAVARVAKTGYAVKAFTAHDPTLDLTAISTDAYGYVAATFGSPGGPTWVDDFDASGNVVRSSSGAYFMLNTTVGHRP